MVEVKIGLEIHTYLLNRVKLFCDCAIDKDAKPNSCSCPVCTGQPGSKPMLVNKEAVEKILAISLMLDCKVNRRLLFQRKHYSWPDLPSGYQRTMSGVYSTPTAVDGLFHGIRISDVHLEEDPARWNPDEGTVDYNRSGFPLAEIVTAPDFTSADQVVQWLHDLLLTLSYVRAVDKEAGIKCDVNVSIAPDFTRVEVKNVHSVSAIRDAILYEVKRQSGLSKKAQETRMWDEADKETKFMRSKETGIDYMFIPDPDLPLIMISDKMVKKIEKSLPEKPKEKIAQYVRLGVEKTDAEIIGSNIVLAELFDKVLKKVDPAFASKWFRRDVLAALNLSDADEFNIPIDYLVDWFVLLKEGKISPIIAKELLDEFFKKPFDIKARVKEKGLHAEADDDVLNGLCREAIDNSKVAVKEYRSGNDKALNAIVGFVMKKTGGKADPVKVSKILKELLK
jgi:aspartyl-tRNA(Asn)/glutamyl-tRNA(Gln) amidotransferase subunit B